MTRGAPRLLPRRLSRVILRDLMLWVAMILGGVTLVYVSDKLITHLLFEVLEFRAGTLWLLRLLTLSLPDILYVALPASVTIAVYLTLLARREAREFLVLAASGCAPSILTGLALKIGLGALVGALFFSGFVEPLARYRFLGVLHDLRFATILTGQLPPGTTRTLGPITLHALPAGPEGGPARLVLGQQTEGGGRTVITAASPEIVTPEIGRPLVLRLRSARVLIFPPGNEAVFPPVSEPAVRLAIAEMRFSDPRVMLDQFPARPINRATMTLNELWATALQGDVQAARLALRKLWQGLVCLFAPFLGLLAMTRTRPGTVLLALPGACGAVLLAAFFGGQLAAQAALLGPLTALALLVLPAVAAAGLITLAVRRDEPGCIRPERVQL